MTQDELKVLVGRAALAHVVPDAVIGVGTGSTVNCFIDALATMRDRVAGAVSSSEALTTTRRWVPVMAPSKARPAPTRRATPNAARGPGSAP